MVIEFFATCPLSYLVTALFYQLYDGLFVFVFYLMRFEPFIECLSAYPKTLS